eukprot:TRINITY_DN54082_c0_g1_i1.p1 TRINITY_DN54082_c0_g1~~TRINITY_DN54082_c0_g1_i1.p1  ORF type:complete len:119 (+),score=0.04 TRINITY_DN54082_c0_g1_i1:50-406(+)
MSLHGPAVVNLIHHLDKQNNSAKSSQLRSRVTSNTSSPALAPQRNSPFLNPNSFSRLDDSFSLEKNTATQPSLQNSPPLGPRPGRALSTSSPPLDPSVTSALTAKEDAVTIVPLDKMV